MSTRYKNKTTSQTGTASLEFDDFELQATRLNFLKEEEKESGKGIWNIATISGMAMLFIALTYALQWIGLPISRGLADFSVDAITTLPLIGGILVTLIGFGFFVGDRRKMRKARREERKKRKEINRMDIHGSEESKESFSGTFKNDLDSDFRSKAEEKEREASIHINDYGYRHARKLVRSRTDKKVAGVCGGLAKYFGVSSTVVRFIFIAAFLMYGTSLLIYFGLALAMPKEPVELMDDFDF